MFFWGAKSHIFKLSISKTVDTFGLNAIHILCDNGVEISIRARDKLLTCELLKSECDSNRQNMQTMSGKFWIFGYLHMTRKGGKQQVISNNICHIVWRTVQHKFTACKTSWHHSASSASLTLCEMTQLISFRAQHTLLTSYFKKERWPQKCALQQMPTHTCVRWIAKTPLALLASCCCRVIIVANETNWCKQGNNIYKLHTFCAIKIRVLSVDIFLETVWLLTHTYARRACAHPVR